MAEGTGYICMWTVDDAGGIIHVCDGDNLVGDDVAFPFEKCLEEVQEILKERDIAAEVDCPPPTGSLRVRFHFDVLPGNPPLEIAVNVGLN